MKFLDILFQFFYPMRCPVCDEILPFKIFDIPKAPFICASCYKKLSFNNETRCFKCSKPLVNENETFCEDCKNEKRFFDAGFGMLLHDESAKKIIYGLKFGCKKDNAKFIGYEMARLFFKNIYLWNADAIIPVPLHPKKKRKRGFNQADVIANELSSNLLLFGINIKVDMEFLLRNVNTRPQKNLNAKQRMKNVHGAFTCSTSKKYKSVILIDDIFTSGSTINEAARVLKNAGVQKVYFLTTSIVY